MELSSSFLDYFKPLKDPRKKTHNHRHQFFDILVLTILATICGAEGFVDIEEFGLAKESWLKTFLHLPHGIPSHDTLGRVFSLLNPDEFFACFSDWINTLSIPSANKVIAIDGKTLRGSHNRKQGKSAIHLVSAWASEQGLLLGQVKTEDKSNEITAIPKLLKMIDIQHATITIDAMGCQREIAKQIVAQGGHYVLTLKRNQPSLRQEVGSIFAYAMGIQFKNVLHRRVKKKEHAHGRIDTRIYTLISAKDNTEFKKRWPGLEGIGRVEYTRNLGNDNIETEVTYYLTTFNYEKMDEFIYAVRKHWGIENNLHWSMDVSFNEDACRIRTGHAAENLATVRRIALNLLKQEKTRKTGIATARKRAGWDHEFLLRVLTSNPITLELTQD